PAVRNAAIVSTSRCRQTGGHLPFCFHRQGAGGSNGDDSSRKNHRREWFAGRAEPQSDGRFGNVAGISCGGAKSSVGIAHASRPAGRKSKVAAGIQTLFPIVRGNGRWRRTTFQIPAFT